jgi:NAD+ kinase
VRGWKYALNEVVMSKDDTAAIISAHAYLNGKELTTYKADGLIVATPTGSTAYNLSVGGPILQPTAPVWVVSPIAAHSLGMRPLVVDDNSQMEIEVTGRGHTFRLTIDGRSTTVPFDMIVKLRKAPFSTKIVKLNGTEFQDVLRNKLMFN